MQTKLLLCGIIAITIISPALAARIQPENSVAPGVGGSTTCDNTTLGQSENNSTANVEADWIANTIHINWYIDENTPTIVATNTCTYDGTITLPTQPTKTGYTFTGWQIRNSVNCSGLNTKSACNSNSACLWYNNNTCLDIVQTTSNCHNANIDTCESLPLCFVSDPSNPRKAFCAPQKPRYYCTLLDNFNDCEIHAWACDWNSNNHLCQSKDPLCNQYTNANDCATSEFCIWNNETTRCISNPIDDMAQ